MGLIRQLGPGLVGIDTAIFIYFIEEHPQFLPSILPLFREADEGVRELVTSALTLVGMLVSDLLLVVVDPRIKLS